MADRFDTPGAFELPELGSAFWMDAHYIKYVRENESKCINECGCDHTDDPSYDGQWCGYCNPELGGDGEHLFICPLHPEPWRD